MCGIAGTYGYSTAAALRMTQEMCDRMTPRGPDDGGCEVVSADPPVVLGNRRLSIIDPSPAGHQPMHALEWGGSIVFNGMIYNFRELRARLEKRGHRFVSDCDTEVILRAYAEYGTRCVHYLRGMWAFAIWDPRRGALFLSRDRMGIKPLYYTSDGQRTAFASEVRSLTSSGAAATRLSTAGIGTFLDFGAVSEPLTAIQGVLALPPGHSAIVNADGVALTRYWAPPEASPEWPKCDAAEELAAIVEDAVGRHMVSDAPIGVFLSGGVDSSLISALATRHATDVRTVSVVFEDPAYDEERHQLTVARTLGTEHHALRLMPDDLIAWFPHVFRGMDQPAFDGLNTYTAARIAHECGLKVAVSGLGADELLDGYGLGPRIERLERLSRLPVHGTRALALTVGALTRASRRDKLAAWLSGDVVDPHELLRRLFLPVGTDALLPGAGEGTAAHKTRAARRGANDLAVSELSTYMRNVLLRDTDSMGMANSIEVRVPYLDHVVVEYVLSLPPSARATGKTLLRAAFPDAIPAEIYDRPKRGFALPLAGWMRGPLHAEMQSLLASDTSPLGDILDLQAVKPVWTGFLAGRRSWLQPWALFCLGKWIENVTAT